MKTNLVFFMTRFISKDWLHLFMFVFERKRGREVRGIDKNRKREKDRARERKGG